MSRLVALYPAAWRERYEEEFLSLIRDRPPSLGERFDIVRGAVDARLHPQVRRPNDAPLTSESEDDLRLARRFGIGALVGAALWPAALGIVLMGPVVYDGQGAYRDGSASFPVWFAATALIALGMLGQVIRLPRTARVARFSAAAAIPAILIFGTGPWLWMFGLAAVVLMVLLALGGFRAGTWPAWASLTVVGACLTVFGVAFVAMPVMATGDRMAGGVYFALMLVVLVPVWLCLGATLIRPSESARPT